MKKAAAIRGLQPKRMGLLRSPEAKDAAARAVETINAELQKVPPHGKPPSPAQMKTLHERISRIADRYFVDLANDEAVSWPEIVNQTKPLAKAAATLNEALDDVPSPVRTALNRQRNFSTEYPPNGYSLSALRAELRDLLTRCAGILDPLDEADIPFQPPRETKRGPPPQTCLTRLVDQLTILRLKLYGEPFSGSADLVKPQNREFAQHGPHFVLKVALCIDSRISPGSVRTALKERSRSKQARIPAATQQTPS